MIRAKAMAGEVVADIKRLFAVGLGLLALGLLPTTAAARPRLSYAGTAGSNSYVGHDISASAPLSEKYEIGVGLSTYRSDFTGGTFKTYSGRLVRTYKKGFWRLSGSITPEVNGFRSRRFGLGLSHRIADWTTSVGERDVRSSLRLSARYARVLTHDNASADGSGSIGGTSGMMSMGSMHGSGGGGTSDMVRQNDLAGGVGLILGRTLISGSIAKSFYDEDTAGSMMGRGRRTEVQGVSPLLEGYPDRSVGIRVSREVSSRLWGWLSYDNIAFKAGSPSANSYAGGIGISWGRIDTTIEYSRYLLSGRTPRNYVSLGGVVRLGKKTGDR